MWAIRAKGGSNLGGASAHNRRVVLEALRLNGASSRAALARATRLTAQTLSNIMDELEREGLVRAEAPVRSGRGQPAVPYRLVAEGAYAIGVQIDRHCARAVAVDLFGVPLARGEAGLPPGGPARGVPVVQDLVETVRAMLLHRAPGAAERLLGLGVAMPGPFGLASNEPDPWMMAEWHRYPLVEALAQGTGLEVRLQNDAAAAALAEKLSGGAHGVDHAVCLFFGYGLGAGIIAGGELYRGRFGNAGEVGLIRLPEAPGGHLVPVEYQASLASLCRALDLDPASPALFAALDGAILASDPRLGPWLDGAARHLRSVVQIIESLLDPEVVIFGGQAPAALFDLLLARMQPLLPSIADRPERPGPRIRLGAADPFAVALGAAAEPISRAFDPKLSALLK